MKKIIAAILTLTLVAALFTAMPTVTAEAEEAVTINVYNWGQYIGVGEDDTIDVNAEFTKRTGIKVNYTTYDSNETMLKKLETCGTSYDIIIPSHDKKGYAREAGFLQHPELQIYRRNV